MLNISKWFAGFVIAMTQVTKNFVIVSAVQECASSTIKSGGGKLMLDCANDGIDKVPQGYDSANIEILNISYTAIEKFKTSDFDAYKKLQVLEMRGLSLNREDSIPEDLFKGLLLLEYLDISGSNGNYKIPTKLPVNLKYFLLNEVDKGEQFDFSVLDKLVELHMAQTICSDLPKLSKITPLVIINLLNSPAMDNLHYEDIAKFCLLRELRISIQSRLDLPDKSEQCWGIVVWTKTFNISGVDKNLHCYGTSDVSLSSAALEERNECLVRHGLRLRKLWIYLIILGVVLLLLAVLAFVAYRLYDRYYLNPLKPDKFVENEKMEEEGEITSSMASVDESSIKSP